MSDHGTLLSTNETTLTLAGTVVKAVGGVIEANDGNATIVLDGAEIDGGFLKTLYGGVIETMAGGASNELVGSTIGVASTVTVADNSVLGLSGTITDNGAIDLGSTGDTTKLTIDSNVRLAGVGTIVLSDVPGTNTSPANEIVASGATSAAPVTLVNAAPEIEGAGFIRNGDATLKLNNQGTIKADGANALTIDTGNTVMNSGRMFATGGGGLVVDDAVSNVGTISANGGNVALDGATISGSKGTLIATNNGQITLNKASVAGFLETTLGGTIVTAAGTSNFLDGFNGSTITAGSAVGVSDNSVLTLMGAITNSREIDLNSSGDVTTLQIEGSVQLGGGGKVILSDSTENVIGSVPTGGTSTISTTRFPGRATSTETTSRSIPAPARSLPTCRLGHRRRSHERCGGETVMHPRSAPHRHASAARGAARSILQPEQLRARIGYLSGLSRLVEDAWEQLFGGAERAFQRRERPAGRDGENELRLGCAGFDELDDDTERPAVAGADEAVGNIVDKTVIGDEQEFDCAIIDGAERAAHGAAAAHQRGADIKPRRRAGGSPQP
jgi:hypothetical protein